MKLLTAPRPSAGSPVPQNIQETLNKLWDQIDDFDTAFTPSSNPDAEVRDLRAHQVPEGGMFEWQGEFWLRTTGKTYQSNSECVSLNRPCKAVRVSDGAFVGLNEARVKYYPNANVCMG